MMRRWNFPWVSLLRSSYPQARRQGPVKVGALVAHCRGSTQQESGAVHLLPLHSSPPEPPGRLSFARAIETRRIHESLCQQNGMTIPLLEDIETACNQAKALIAQLLQFSRPDKTEARMVALNSVVEDASDFLRALMPKKIEIEKKLAPQPCSIKANPSMIMQIITNLAINARDAMPDGGRLRIETARFSSVEDPSHAPLEAALGCYCLIKISDTGSGMSRETRERIFEPFFTTKERGKGTGLGLAVVYGIVKNLGGWITVLSEPGAGTTFEIYIPETEEAGVLQWPPFSW